MRRKTRRARGGHAARPVSARTLLPAALVLLALSGLAAPAASASDPGQKTYRSRFQVRVGAVRGFEADSAETHFALGAAAMLNLRRPVSVGLEGSLQDFLDDSFHHSSLGLVRVTGFVEYRPGTAGRVLPFVAAGAGLYSWRWCDGSPEGEMYFCSSLRPDRRENSLGAWLGPGIHCGIKESRSLTAALEIHPYSTSDKAPSFAHLFLALGW